MTIIVHVSCRDTDYVAPVGVQRMENIGEIAVVYELKGKTIILIKRKRNFRSISDKITLSCEDEPSNSTQLLTTLKIIEDHYHLDLDSIMYMVIDAYPAILTRETIEIVSETPFIYPMLLSYWLTNELTRAKLPKANYHWICRCFLYPFTTMSSEMKDMVVVRDDIRDGAPYPDDYHIPMVPTLSSLMRMYEEMIYAEPFA